MGNSSCGAMDRGPRKLTLAESPRETDVSVLFQTKFSEGGCQVCSCTQAVCLLNVLHHLAASWTKFRSSEDLPRGRAWSSFCLPPARGSQLDSFRDSLAALLHLCWPLSGTIYKVGGQGPILTP